MSIVAKIANAYLGQTEIYGNRGFTLDKFEEKMKEAGWKKGQAWCSYFVELVLKESFPEKFDELDKLCSANAVRTYHNFKAAGYDTHNIPRVGDIVIFMRFKNGKAVQISPGWWSGHIGVVSRVNEGLTDFHSIEGNTNDAGGREGYIVAEQGRNNDILLGQIDNGLKVIGFITIE